MDEWSPPPLSGGSARPRYRAFVSYSHAVDGRLAPALRRALHAFAKPWYRLRALRVFRDEASLSANPDLWSSIEQALDESEYFILLASPEAAGSEWVNREVEHWLRTRSADSMLLVLTDGELDWSAEAGTERSALPAALRGVFRSEPRHVDLRWARTVDDLSHRQPRFRECVADLAATLHGRPKDELIGDDVRYHRRALRLAGSGAVALFLVAVLAATLAVVASRARDEAQLQARVATSRFLAAESVRDSAGLLDRALLLGVEAQGLHDSPDARSALLTELTKAGSVSAFLYGPAPLDDVEFSPDGRLLAAAAEDGAVMLWDTGTRQPAGAPLIGHGSWVHRVAFAPNGRTLVSADVGGEVIFWDLLSRSRIDSGSALDLTDLAVSPDGRLLVSAGELGVTVWDLERHSKIGELPVDPGTTVNRVVFTSDGRTLITGDQAGEILLWAVPADPAAPPATWGSERLAVQADQVVAMSASPNGPLLAVGEGHDVVFWNVPERRLDGERLAGSGGNVLDLTFTADGAKLVVGGGDLGVTVVVWDVAGRAQDDYLLQDNTGAANRLAVDPTGSTVAVTASDNRLRLWDLTRRTPLDTPLAGDTGSGFRSVAFSPDGRTIAAGDARAGVELWDAAQRTRRHLLQHSGAGMINDIAFSPDGTVLAVAGSDNWISRWNVRTGEPVGELIQGYTDEALEELETPVGGVERIVFSPDGRTLIAATNGRVQRWELPSGRPLGGPLPAPENGQRWEARIAVNPAGTVLAVGSRTPDDPIALWDLGGNQYTGPSLRGAGLEVAELAFSPDGRSLVAGTGGLGVPGSVHGWELATGQEWGPPLTGFAAAVSAVAFDPVGQTLAVGAAAGTGTGTGTGTTPGHVSLWDAASRQRIGPDLAYSNVVYDVAFSPDGRTLAAVDGSTALTLLNLDLQSWRELACQIANRNLSRAEWAQYLGGDVPYRSTCPGLPTPGG